MPNRLTQLQNRRMQDLEDEELQYLISHSENQSVVWLAEIELDSKTLCAGVVSRRRAPVRDSLDLLSTPLSSAVPLGEYHHGRHNRTSSTPIWPSWSSVS